MSARTDEIERLYHEAFAKYRAAALWSTRHLPRPTPGQALAITGTLRTKGDLDARRLAERIEALCRAAD